MILSPIGKLYGHVMDVRNGLYDRGIFKSHHLGARTISVGNLTTGGTGKTPLVVLISEILLDAGETVCILTRGYGRANSRSRVLVSDGETVLADAGKGGDEPVELGQRLGGRVIIVADPNRLSAGRWAKDKFGITAFVLDDGYQHRRVRRDLDIVCVDATDPCGDGRILPAGSLRESFANLKRADAIVLTRTELVDDTSAIKNRLRKRNDEAPIFDAGTRMPELVPLREFHAKSQSKQRVGSESEPAPRAVTLRTAGSRCGVFCGLGNPEAFFKTIYRYFVEAEKNNGRIVYRQSFADHHRYKQENIDNLEREAKEAGAEFLVTTAKDAVKLKEVRFSLPCFVAVAETAIDDVETFRRLVCGETSEFHL